MRFTNTAVLLLSAAVSLAAALPTTSQVDAALDKRALVDRTYAEIQISDGVAGNAADEAKAKFPVRSSVVLLAPDGTSYGHMLTNGRRLTQRRPLQQTSKLSRKQRSW